jgi:hypothetical protein
VVYPVHKETHAVVYPVHGEETHAVVYPTKTEEIKTITVCKAEHGATDYPVHNGVVTITKTLTQTIVNGDKKEYKTDVVYETKPVVFETKTDVYGSKQTIPVYPVKPTENKPVAPVYPAKNNGTSPPAKVYVAVPFTIHLEHSADHLSSYPTAPVKYTGAASSLSVAGFVAGAGAIAAFFL